MKIVILAAGSGTRMGALTKITPKSLINICEKPVLSHIFDVLKQVVEISEIILVVNSEKIALFQEFIARYCVDVNKNITIIPQIDNMKGTYAALLSAKNKLEEGEEFLVANGDDIHCVETYEKVIKNNFLVFAIQETTFKQGYYNVMYDHDNFLVNFSQPKEKLEKMFLGTGLYKLSYSFFSIEPVQIFGGEFGIPQTLLKFSKEFNVSKVKVVQTFNSLFLNTQDDLNKINCDFLEKIKKSGEKM